MKPVAEDVLAGLGRPTTDLSVIDIKGPDAPSGAIGHWETFRVTRIQSGFDVFDLDLRVSDYLDLLNWDTEKVRRRILNALRASNM